jgi:hypothetical protein
MEVLPPKFRQYVAWFHVPSGKLGYTRLPDSGLVVLFDKSDDKQDQSDRLSGGHYVLYFDGKVQPDSNVIFDYNLDSYLTVVPDGFSHYYPGTAQ